MGQGDQKFTLLKQTLYELLAQFPAQNTQSDNYKLPFDSALSPVDEEYRCKLCDHIVFPVSCCSGCVQFFC
jgi:hypothetical protein